SRVESVEYNRRAGAWVAPNSHLVAAEGHCAVPEPPSTIDRERPAGPISRVVGLYQTFLRRSLEHFFPEAVLDVESDRSVINWDGGAEDDHFAVANDPDGVGLRIDWFQTRYVFQHASPTPFLPAERRLIEFIVHSLHPRFP